MTPAGRHVFKKPRLSATPACPGGQTGTSRARRSVACEGTARRARGPPVRYRDKPAQRQRGILLARRSTGHGEETASSGKNSLATCGAIKERRTAFPLRTKNRLQTKNHYLTGKAPYKFESTSLQRRVYEPSVPPERQRRTARIRRADSRRRSYRSIWVIAFRKASSESRMRPRRARSTQG
jgi:hypothetical protein